MFALTSNITIGNFSFSGVHSVQIKRSIHSYVDTATIVLPALSRILKKDSKVADAQFTADMFNDGDTVTINLGYDGDLQEEFRGFVTRRNINKPLEIECEGYSYKLKNTSIDGSWKTTSVKELASTIKAAAGLKDVIVHDDISLSQISSYNGSCAALLDKIKKATNDSLTIFFPEPDVLWIGLLLAPYATGTSVLNLPAVNYRIGYNCLDENSLKLRTENDDPVQVTYVKRQAGGQAIKGDSKKVKTGRQIVKLLGHLTEVNWLQLLAQETAYSINYIGYEGGFQGFLAPYALPGYNAYLLKGTDTTGSEYLIETTQVSFGQNGARRYCEISHKKGWDVAGSKKN